MSWFDPAGLTVYVDGEYIRGDHARVSIFDHGLLYGDGVFEGMRAFDGALFRPEEHLRRLARSARALALTLPLSEPDLLEVISEVVRRSGLQNAHIRPIVTRGFGAPGLDPWRCPHPTLIVAAYAFPPLLGEQPLRVMVSSVARKAPRSLGADVKSLNYLDGILAKQQARAAGKDEAVMLDVFGAVAECTATNIFLISGEQLVTPTTRAALPGITRKTILELAHEHGIATTERDVWPMELYAADAMFVTGSGAGVVAVGEIDGRALQSEANAIFTALRDGYIARTRDPRYLVPLITDGRSPGASEAHVESDIHSASSGRRARPSTQAVSPS